VTLQIDAPTMAVTLIAVVLLVIFTARRGRIFCNTLCPVGSALSLPARVALFAPRIDPERCTSCGICETVCKAGCASSAHKRIDHENCVSCFNCIDVCPFDALHYSSSRATPERRLRDSGPGRRVPRLGGLRKRTAQQAAEGDGRSTAGISRRSFLTRMTGAVSAGTAYSILPVSFAFRKRATGPVGRENAPASPPGSQSIAEFTARCVACHLCVSRCPTSVLQPSLFEYGLKGLMQPVMDYGRAFCEYECNICTQVCPTGAIRPVSLAEKQKIQIGTVHFIEDRCVVFTDGTACGACAEVCPTQACHMVPHEKGLTKPVTENEICIGCGNCEYACPVEGGKAIYVVGKEEHTVREVRSPEYPAHRPQQAAGDAAGRNGGAQDGGGSESGGRGQSSGGGGQAGGDSDLGPWPF
jgi:ferredoxin